MTSNTERPRLIEVAKLAGVSIRTVSNVVNRYPHVAPSTRERVQQAIIQLGYRPNLVARNLVNGRTGLVALVVPRLEMPYFASLAQHMLEVAEAEGVVLVLQQTHDSHELELKALEGSFGQPLDGIMLSSTTLGNEDILRRNSTLPLVLLGNRTLPGTVSSVAIDQVAAARTAVTHLFELGRRRVAFIGPGASQGSNARWLGWVQAHEAAGLPITPSLQVDTDGTSGEHGVAAGLRVATARFRPDAVFCFTDWLALGVTRGLQRSGVSVPDDVAVVGFDDIPYGRASNPTLTTICPDRGQIAALALRSVLDQANGDSSPKAHLANWHLIVRESSGEQLGGGSEVRAVRSLGSRTPRAASMSRRRRRSRAHGREFGLARVEDRD